MSDDKTNSNGGARFWVAVGLGAFLLGAVPLLIACCGDIRSDQTAGKHKPVVVLPSSTKILVRGGAMTAYTLDATWNTPLVSGQKSNCVDLPLNFSAGTAYIVLEDHADPNAGGGQWMAQDFTWVVEIFGNNSGDGSSSGLKFTAQNSDCKQDGIVGTSILVTTMGTGMFYSKNLPPIGHRMDDRRLKFAGDGKDEDMYERMSAIRVTIDPTSRTVPDPTPCKHSDCSVYIGQK